MTLITALIISLVALVGGVLIAAANMARMWSNARIGPMAFIVQAICGLLIFLGGIGSILTGALLLIQHFA